MVINFDEWKDGEPITIIEDGVARSYSHPRVTLSYIKCFPPTRTIDIRIEGEDVLYMESNGSGE